MENDKVRLLVAFVLGAFFVLLLNLLTLPATFSEKIVKSFSGEYEKIHTQLIAEESGLRIKNLEDFQKEEAIMRETQNENLYKELGEYYGVGTDWLAKDYEKRNDYFSMHRKLKKEKALKGENVLYLKEMSMIKILEYDAEVRGEALGNVVNISKKEIEKKQKKEEEEILQYLEAFKLLEQNCSNAKEIYEYLRIFNERSHFTFLFKAELKKHVNSYAKTQCIPLYNKYN